MMWCSLNMFGITFLLAFLDRTLSVDMGQQKPNLTSITWAHAVNSRSLLNEALSSSIEMIEADIVLGTLFNDTSGIEIPVMGHPPANQSDLSLQSFLRDILEYNNGNVIKKGVKLDFKSTEVFEGSLTLLSDIWNDFTDPVWLNADIIAGPINNTETEPVDPTIFLQGCKKLPSAVLSIGWTTRWGQEFRDGHYTRNQINNMVTAIKDNIGNTNHHITFPVRAGIAAHSIPGLHDLVQSVNSTNNVTLTIWSSSDDYVDIGELRKLIFSFGLDKVYVDVPEEVSNQLDLSNAPGGASSLINFGIISLAMVLLSLILSNTQV